ncbi:MAG: hypothetical protein OXU61_03825 [Gammaproteobacteria bacterium]|nr:hypothetical protein [Gammaproteobacteria bacterium]
MTTAIVKSLLIKSLFTILSPIPHTPLYAPHCTHQIDTAPAPTPGDLPPKAGASLDQPLRLFKCLCDARATSLPLRGHGEGTPARLPPAPGWRGGGNPGPENQTPAVCPHLYALTCDRMGPGIPWPDHLTGKIIRKFGKAP